MGTAQDPPSSQRLVPGPCPLKHPGGLSAAAFCLPFCVPVCGARGTREEVDVVAVVTPQSWALLWPDRNASRKMCRSFMSAVRERAEDFGVGAVVGLAFWLRRADALGDSPSSWTVVLHHRLKKRNTFFARAAAQAFSSETTSFHPNSWLMRESATRPCGGWLP